jgi:hypothetical protein
MRKEKENLKLSDYQFGLYVNWVADTHYQKMGDKTTVCVVKLHNGFEISGTSACVNPADFDEEVGRHYALVDALNWLDKYAGFYNHINNDRTLFEGVMEVDLIDTHVDPIDIDYYTEVDTINVPYRHRFYTEVQRGR